MLDDGNGRTVEIRNELHGRLYVKHVVVGYLLSVELNRQSTIRPEEHGFLMGILAVAEMCGTCFAGSECRYVFPAVEILEDAGVVAGTFQEGPGGEHSSVFQGGDTFFGAQKFQQVCV